VNFIVTNRNALSQCAACNNGVNRATKKSKREVEIDAARGLMLVWMTLTHLPTVLTPWVNQPFGYISASEGFIFLSALFTGRIYYRVLARDGLNKMSAKLFSRTLRLYGYHVLLLLIAFTIAARYALTSRGQGLYNLLDYFFTAGHAHAIREALLLVYRPPLLDIVPLYIIFLLITPPAIYAARRFGWKWIMVTSAGLWLAAQFGLREFVHEFLTRHAGWHIPLNETGAFNPWTWQLEWTLGLWCGVAWAKGGLQTEKWATRTWIPAAVVVAGLLALRYAQIFGLDLGWASVFFDKWNLGPGRLVNFAAVAMLLIRFRPQVKVLAVRPLVLLGQASLQVFCTHFLFCFLAIGMMGSGDRIHGWPQAALLAVTFAALLLVAKIYGRPQPAGEEAKVSPPVPQQLPAMLPTIARSKSALRTQVAR
jgi:hypothetical protein